MRIRRSFVVVLALSVLSLVAFEVQRMAIAVWLLRGEYGRVERWGGDRYFISAARHQESHQDSFGLGRIRLAEWADHRYSLRFPEEQVHDVHLLPSGELALLLRRTGEERNRESQKGDSRVVILDPIRGDALTAATDYFDHYAWKMIWKSQAVLVYGGEGTMVLSNVFLREGARFRLFPCDSGTAGNPSFWGAVSFGDWDSNGVPGIVSAVWNDAACPHCRETPEQNTITWNAIDGSYRKCLERCGSCKYSWVRTGSN